MQKLVICNVLWDVPKSKEIGILHQILQGEMIADIKIHISHNIQCSFIYIHYKIGRCKNETRNAVFWLWWIMELMVNSWFSEAGTAERFKTRWGSSLSSLHVPSFTLLIQVRLSLILPNLDEAQVYSFRRL
jgi:hypothetical protein